MRALFWIIVLAAIAVGIGWLVVSRTPAPAAAPDRAALLGAWLETVPLGDGSHLGFELLDDGTVLSINTATLTYAGWSLDGSRLTLAIQSTGSGGTTEEPVTYDIRALSADGATLELADPGGNVLTYRRERPEEKAKNERFTPVFVN